jgi:hypothetical protein
MRSRVPRSQSAAHMCVCVGLLASGTALACRAGTSGLAIVCALPNAAPMLSP